MTSKIYPPISRSPWHIATLHRCRWWLNRAKHRFASRYQRFQRATAYFNGTMTAEQAQGIAWDVQFSAGEYPLISLTVDDVMADALERWEDHPSLRRLCDGAVSYVAGHWDDHTEVRSTCAEWALTVIADDARNDGIELIGNPLSNT